ncbi:SDR family oxidoreductase [Rhizobium sp. WYCCWR 11279]|uniref:UDP-glucuronic acid decarboxylase family protein n=1 Tax=Rhizobium TaxID=379 RepID=UPI00149303AE|nr:MULTISPECIES: UDP-glucuronic acid decarboxylase family protein [Rhizobium]MCV9944953.1 SDR family oxidoreductase [Rhizobium sp. BT-175]MCW0018574.1 SDR family oxidoreductase [Rhizobium sp. BT-226]NNU47324.1 SDR family oxidoreductase [Rhizobium changzhiense]
MRSFVPSEGYSEVSGIPVAQALRTVLVNGGGGFLGSHLCERLLQRGHRVICLDNFSTGRRANVDHLASNTHFHIVEHDVRQPFDIEASLIFNFASPASPPDYQRDPVGTLLTNVLGAVNTLDCARKTGAIVVQSSTSEVYGDPIHTPQHESYCGNVNQIGPRGCYDEGKRSAETLFFDYHRTYGVDIKVGRIFNTYGPRMRLDDGRVVSNFIVQALRNADLTIYGDGQQTRSFCYVDDLIEGFLRFSAAGSACNGPINLGNPAEMTVRRLAEVIRNLTNSRSRIVHLPAVTDDPRQRRPDISRAMAELGWQPRIGLETGLARTVDYFDGLLAGTEKAEVV